MAMLDEYGPTAAEMRESFDKAAKAGARYMLSMSETLSDPMQVTIYHYTDTVASEADILPLVQQRNEKAFYARVSLTGIFDLSRDYDAQKKISGEEQIKTILSANTQAGLLAMHKAAKLQEDLREWAARPWYERIFVSKPF